jgi:hypothetical protein
MIKCFQTQYDDNGIYIPPTKKTGAGRNRPKKDPVHSAGLLQTVRLPNGKVSLSGLQDRRIVTISKLFWGEELGWCEHGGLLHTHY